VTAARAYGLPDAPPPSPRQLMAEVYGEDGKLRAVIFAGTWRRAFALASEDALASLVTCGERRMWRDAETREWRTR
jgi:hypothetical protein